MEYINAIGASKILGCTVKTLYNYVNAGKIPKYLNKGNNRWEFKKKDIEQFMIPCKPKWKWRE